MEDVMGLFSEELRILDRNTVQYMIDEMQDTIDAQKVELGEAKSQLCEKDLQLNEKDLQLNEKDLQLNEKDQLIENLKRKRFIKRLHCNVTLLRWKRQIIDTRTGSL